MAYSSFGLGRRKLAGGALAGLTALAGGAIVAPRPDAELIEIGVQARPCVAQYERLQMKWWALPCGDPGLQACASEMDGPHSRICDFAEKAVDIPSSTPEGWQAKAVLIRHLMNIEHNSEGVMQFDTFRPRADLVVDLRHDGEGVIMADPTPIMAAATRLSQLSALDETDMTDEQLDTVTREQLELQYLITDTAPQSVSDTVVLLMVAAVEISRNALNDDGSFSHEHGEVIVRRVMHFLGEREGLNLNDVGGAFLLPWEGQETQALHGTVAEAVLRFNKVDEARAWDRHDQERAATERMLIRARHGLTSPFEVRS